MFALDGNNVDVNRLIIINRMTILNSFIPFISFGFVTFQFTTFIIYFIMKKKQHNIDKHRKLLMHTTVVLQPMVFFLYCTNFFYSYFILMINIFFLHQYTLLSYIHEYKVRICIPKVRTGLENKINKQRILLFLST